jgi:hypothetical protein
LQSEEKQYSLRSSTRCTPGNSIYLSTRFNTSENLRLTVGCITGEVRDTKTPWMNLTLARAHSLNRSG